MKVKFSDLKPLEKALNNDIHEAFDLVLSSSWYIRGEQCKKFESSFSHYCSTNYCVGVANGLDSLTLSLLSLGIGKNDEVIVPANSFIATALAVSKTGATPVFVDPYIDTYCINPIAVKEKITKNTKAIICVHLYGQPCEMDELIRVSKESGIYLIEDCAQSHGATYKGKKVGGFGAISGFSFYPGKNLGALGDGGAITTNDEELYKFVKIYSNYGSEIKYNHIYTGINSRLDELQAAFLSVKLKYLDIINADRRRVADYYLKNIRNENVILPKVLMDTEPVWHVFALRCKHRDKLESYLNSNGIETNKHYPIPIHLQKCYHSLGYKFGDFPNAEEISCTEISLPIFYGMNLDELEYVVNVVNKFK